MCITRAGKKKVQAELEDTNIELEAQRAKVLELEKKQKSFDKVVAEERAVAERNAAERDAAERDARDKETRVLSLTRELDDAAEKVPQGSMYMMIGSSSIQYC